AGVRERRDRRQRVVELVAHDADDALPRRDLLARELARHPADEMEVVLAPLQAKASPRVVERLVAVVARRREHAVAAGDERIAQRLRRSGEQLGDARANAATTRPSPATSRTNGPRSTVATTSLVALTERSFVSMPAAPAPRARARRPRPRRQARAAAGDASRAARRRSVGPGRRCLESWRSLARPPSQAPCRAGSGANALPDKHLAKRRERSAGPRTVRGQRADTEGVGVGAAVGGGLRRYFGTVLASKASRVHSRPRHRHATEPLH